MMIGLKVSRKGRRNRLELMRKEGSLKSSTEIFIQKELIIMFKVPIGRVK